ncbi:MAG: hypothetical protein COB02_14755 [Candidatus Cloacimonadota bacterium]|nr:MAG: hypothetical protein COB02_14755 [Candidatus Cloacimonadota bacterium]
MFNTFSKLFFIFSFIFQSQADIQSINISLKSKQTELKNKFVNIQYTVIQTKKNQQFELTFISTGKCKFNKSTIKVTTKKLVTTGNHKLSLCLDGSQKVFVIGKETNFSKLTFGPTLKINPDLININKVLK